MFLILSANVLIFVGNNFDNKINGAEKSLYNI